MEKERFYIDKEHGIVKTTIGFQSCCTKTFGSFEEAKKYHQKHLKAWIKDSKADLKKYEIALKKIDDVTDPVEETMFWGVHAYAEGMPYTVRVTEIGKLETSFTRGGFTYYRDESEAREVFKVKFIEWTQEAIQKLG